MKFIVKLLVKKGYYPSSLSCNDLSLTMCSKELDNEGFSMLRYHCPLAMLLLIAEMISHYKIKLLWWSSRAGKWKSPIFFMRPSRICIDNTFCKKIGRDRFIPAWAARMANYLVWPTTVVDKQSHQIY